MAQILIRNLDSATIKRLKERARQHNWTVEVEARSLLERAAEHYAMSEKMRAAALRWQKRTSRRNMSDSVDLLREDRER